MESLRQRRQSTPKSRVLETGEPEKARRTGTGARIAAVAFLIASLAFVVHGGSRNLTKPGHGGHGDGASLRKRKDAIASHLVPGYTDALSEEYRKKRHDLAVARSRLNPAEEHAFTSHKLKRYFDCKRVTAKRPVIAEDEWRYFRDLYNEFIALEASQGRNETYKLGARHVPSPVRGVDTPDKGRGLVASRDIARGGRVFTATNNTIVYRTGRAWREFLLHLYYSPPLNDHYKDGFACDIMSWSWNQKVEMSDSGVKFAILVDLDVSSLLNKPNHDQDSNIQCGELVKDSKCGMDYYAVRDIRKGEEILCEYSDFSSPKWHKFGL